jgi:hypothetical protein
LNRLFGKSLPQYDRRTLKLASYVDPGKLVYPEADDNYTKMSQWTMAQNDTHSCCVVSGAVHMVQVWSSMAARERIISDKELLKAYNKLSPNDYGLNVLSFLNWWRKNPIDGHPLGAFVAVNPTNIEMLKAAIHLFGGVFTGLGLPRSAQDQKVWDVGTGGRDTEAYSWGGHLTICCEYDRRDRLYNYTWGESVPMSSGFVKCYCDEAYALLSLDWFKADHKTPDGLAWADLKADLARVKG